MLLVTLQRRKMMTRRTARLVRRMTTLDWGQTESSQWRGSSQCSQAALQPRQSTLSTVSARLARRGGADRKVRRFLVNVNVHCGENWTNSETG